MFGLKSPSEMKTGQKDPLTVFLLVGRGQITDKRHNYPIKRHTYPAAARLCLFYLYGIISV